MLQQGSDIFATTATKQQREQNDRESRLYEQIGRLNMELDWLKKKLPQTAEQRRKLVKPDHPQLSIRRQCELLGFSRSTLYYQPATESKENLHLMRRIDQQYMQTPFYGSRRMTHHLKQLGYRVKVGAVPKMAVGATGLIALVLIGFIGLRQMNAPIIEERVYLSPWEDGTPRPRNNASTKDSQRLPLKGQKTGTICHKLLLRHPQ